MLLEESSRTDRLVKPESNDISDSVMLLPWRCSHSKLVRPESGDRSVMLLFKRTIDVRLVKPPSGEMSVMLLSSSHSSFQVGQARKRRDVRNAV